MSDPARDQLAVAYEQRTTQLYETRGALAEAVYVLTAELIKHREDSAGLREHAERLAAEAAKQRQHAEQLTVEVLGLRDRTTALEGEIREAHEAVETLRNMKVVRWTTWPRTIAYRLRARRH